MAISRVSTFPIVCAAFSPMLLKYELSDSTQGDAVANVYGYDDDEQINRSVSLTAEFLNLNAQIDVSKIVQSFFRDSRVLRVASSLVGGAAEFYSDYNLYANFGGGDNSTAGAFNRNGFCGVVNAAPQFGESNDMKEAFFFRFLSGFKKFRCYEGYELTAAFLNFPNNYANIILNIDGNDIKKVDGSTLTFSNTKNYHNLMRFCASKFVSISNYFDIYLRDDKGDIIYTPQGDPITVADAPSDLKLDVRQVVRCDVPEHPFYVRWINRFGGYDYWMFSCRQFTKLSLSDSSDAYLYFDDIKSAVTDRRVYNKTAKKSVRVSTGMCDKNELEQLMWMPLSNKIERYDETTSRWQPLICKPTDMEIGSAQVSGSLEFEFELPTPQLAF